MSKLIVFIRMTYILTLHKSKIYFFRISYFIEHSFVKIQSFQESQLEEKKKEREIGARIFKVQFSAGIRTKLLEAGNRNNLSDQHATFFMK